MLRRACDPYGLIVTSGAPRSAAPTLAATRRAEEIAAMGVLGVASDRLDFLSVTDQEAHRRLDEVIIALETKMRRLRPGLVITHDYEQGHPDHDATAFATAIAAGRLDIPCYAYPLYHWQDGRGWFCRFRQDYPQQEVFRLSNQELCCQVPVPSLRMYRK